MKKVLIADDSKSIRMIIKQTLLSEAFDVFPIDEAHIYEANDGLEAFGLLGKHTDIDYFFSDVNMPHLNGDELIEVLNDTGKINQVKVFFVTTENMDGRIDPTVRHCVLGTIQKPLKPQHIIDKVKEFLLLKAKKDTVAKIAKEDLVKQVAKQRQLLFDVISKYCQLSKLEENFDPQMIKEIINVYLSEDDDIPQNEIIAVAPTILSEYFMEKGIEAKIDSPKIQFLFNNYMMDKESVQEDKKDTFVANLMEYDDKMIIVRADSVDMTGFIEKIEKIEKIDSTYDIKEITKRRFNSILNFVKDKQKASGTEKTLSYERMKHFMYQAKDLLIDVDFTIDIKELRYIENIIQGLLQDIEYFENFKRKNSSDYLFTEIFSRYQREYQIYKHVQQFLIANKDKEVEYRKLLLRLDKIVNLYVLNNSKLFYNLFMQQLQKVIISYKNLVDRYTYLYDRLLWERAKESLSVKEYFRKKGISGDLSTKSLLNYHLKINVGKLDKVELKYLTDLVNMLDNGVGKDVVFLSTNLKEGAKIEELIKNIEPNWKFYTLAKLSLIDSWMIANERPDILIIDHNFDMEVQNGIELSKIIFRKYKVLAELKSLVMIFDKVSIDLIEEANKVGIKEHIKRPIVNYEFTNKIRFL